MPGNSYHGLALVDELVGHVRLTQACLNVAGRVDNDVFAKPLHHPLKSFGDLRIKLRAAATGDFGQNS